MRTQRNGCPESIALMRVEIKLMLTLSKEEQELLDVALPTARLRGANDTIRHEDIRYTEHTNQLWTGNGGQGSWMQVTMVEVPEQGLWSTLSSHRSSIMFLRSATG